MRTSFIPSLVYLFLSFGAGASPTPLPSPSPGPGDTTAEINAQMAITRRGIDEILKKTTESVLPSALKVADYRDVSPTFRKNVENALARFEESLKKEVFQAEISPLLNDYASIVTSVSMSRDQKTAALRLMEKPMDDKKAHIEAIYEKIVQQAYLDTGLKLYGMKYSLLEKPNKATRKACNIDGSAWVAQLFETEIDASSDFAFCWALRGAQPEAYPYGGPDYVSYASVDTEWERFFDSAPKLVPFIINQFRDGCRSRLCVSLRATDAFNTLVQMWNIFSRPIDLNLADGTTFRIKAPLFEGVATLRAIQSVKHYSIDDLPLDTE